MEFGTLCVSETNEGEGQLCATHSEPQFVSEIKKTNLTRIFDKNEPSQANVVAQVCVCVWGSPVNMRSVPRLCPKSKITYVPKLPAVLETIPYNLLHLYVNVYFLIILKFTFKLAENWMEFGALWDKRRSMSSGCVSGGCPVCVGALLFGLAWMEPGCQGWQIALLRIVPAGVTGRSPR